MLFELFFPGGRQSVIRQQLSPTIRLRRAFFQFMRIGFAAFSFLSLFGVKKSLLLVGGGHMPSPQLTRFLLGFSEVMMLLRF